MAFFKLKKRCLYCGTALDDKGNCPNKDCINHTENAEQEDASKKEG